MTAPNRIITSNESLKDAMRQMDSERIKLLLVIDNENRFIAPLSMGDIQRFYLQHNSFNATVGEVVKNRKSIVASLAHSRHDIKKEMQEKRLEAMPILTSDNHLVRIIEWNEIIDEKPPVTHIDVPVVIMAGGKGTRMQPLTHVIPKPLIPLGDKSILEHIIKNYADAGCNKFWISINYKAEMIQHYMNQLDTSTLDISYLYEKEFQGTAGSLHLLTSKVNGPIIVCNCDILIESDYFAILEHHKTSQNELTAIAAVHEREVPYGVFECGHDGVLEKLEEKPTYSYLVNTGMYILESHLLSDIPKQGVFHMTDLINFIQARGGKVGIYPISQGSWFDIGNWDDYRKVCRKLNLDEIFSAHTH